MWNGSFSNIKNKLTKQEKDAFENIVLLDSVVLDTVGSSDNEGYQIFTPRFIVKKMVDAIGRKKVFDYNQTILEPTSGDGAFTVYIFEERLENIYKNNKSDFELESLKALSTIYSIEMDKNLIIKQRNNIFTVLNKFILDKNINVSNQYFNIAKCIISTNFIWAMFNSDNEISMLITDVAYKMPDAEKDKFSPLQFPVWTISNEIIDFNMEDAEINV